ncbi:MAG: hypothetical protein RIR00_935 [Pseudomonadota bacterium]|jgi:cytochrome c-type biogenesis protein CcmH
MTAFVLVLALLLLVTLGILLPPLLRRSPPVAAARDHQRSNVAVLREHLAELEQEKANGQLSEADFAVAEAELRRRLLEELPGETKEAAPAVGKSHLRTPLLLLLTIPLLAVAGYVATGSPQALNPLATQAPGKLSPEQIEGMVNQLAEKLKANPDNIEGWIMLGRSYKSMGRVDEAIAVYQRLETKLGEDADFLTDFADLLASKSGGDLEGRPTQLLQKALRLDPNNIIALWLSGTAAFNKKDYAGSVRFWEKALNALPPEMEDRDSLQQSIAEARRRLKNASLPPGKSVGGLLELSPEWRDKVGPTAAVFLIAREEGSRMPLAVARIKVSELPYKFTLDDSFALNGAPAISERDKIVVQARLSQSGNATTSPGDVESAPQTVKVGDHKLKLKLDRAVAVKPAS